MPDGAWTGTLTIGPGWALFGGVPGESTRHAHHALQLCVAGAGPLAVEVRTGSVHRAEAIALPSGAPHAIHAGGPVAFLYLEPDGREGRALSAALAAEGSGAPLRGGLEAVQRRLVRYAASRAADPAARPACGLRDAILALWLPPTEADAGRTPDARVDSVCRRVRARIGESRLGAAELAREVGLSPSRLAALFRAHAGIALRPFVLWTRLERAVEIAGTGRSLTDAALEAGFADSAHLARTFRRMFGTTLSRGLGTLRVARVRDEDPRTAEVRGSGS